jgi:hypothetical protein
MYFFVANHAKTSNYFIVAFIFFFSLYVPNSSSAEDIMKGDTFIGEQLLW